MISFNTVKNFVKACLPTALTTMGVIGLGVFGYSVKKGAEKQIAAKKKHEEVASVIEDAKKDDTFEYTEEDIANDTKVNDLSYARECVKAYIPSVLIGGLTTAAFVGAHCILNKRYLTLGSAFIGVSSAFNKYRENVKEKYGEDADRQFRFNVKDVKQPEDGSTSKKKKQTEKTIEPQHSAYTRCFCKGSPGWTDDAEDRLFYLSKMQRFANDKLNYNKTVTLNEVYEMLGLPKTPQGQLVGWSKKIDKNAKIDFGVYDISDESKRLFINGYEPGIWLDFNVQGDVLQYI